MDNNLIYEYCMENKVAIRFRNMDDLDILHGLFGYKKETLLLWKEGGYVSYTIKPLGPNARSTMTIGGSPPTDHIILAIDEFFTLALPSKSILETIK